MKISVFFFFCILSFVNLSAQQIVMESVHHGNKLYVRNHGTNGKDGCTEKVVINGREVPFKNASAYDINPDSLGFKLGDSLKIIIYHHSDCKPQVLLDNATPMGSFQIISIRVDKSGILYGTAREKGNKNSFVIQQLINNKWEKIGEVKSKGDKKENEYAFKISNGEVGEFRVIQVDEFGFPHCSKSVTFLKTKN